MRRSLAAFSLASALGVLLLAILPISAPLLAQPPAAEPAAEPAGSEPAASGGEGRAFPVNRTVLVVPPGAQAGPDFDIERATQAYIETLSEEKRARSDAYFEGGYWLLLFSFLYSLAVAWVFLGLRLSARLRDKAEALTRRPFLQSLVYALVYIPVAALLALPFGLYEDHFREHQYGMSNQTLGEWLGDEAKGLLVAMILGSLAIAVLYAVFRRAGRSWWVWGWLTGLVFAVFSVLIAPVYIDPLFNDYKPLPEGELRDRILSIAHATGVPADDVVWFDASRQTKRISANVSGFGSTMRVALNDNLLERSPPESIEAVMGHELGHYTLNHIYEGILEIGALLLLCFAFASWAFEWARARWGEKWGIRGIADPAGLPLLAAIFSIYFFVMTPATNSIVRANEAEADRYGIATSGQADGFAYVAMQLSEYRKISPGYWEEILFYDHPSGYNRVRASMEWKAEHGGREAKAAEPLAAPVEPPAGDASAPSEPPAAR